MRRTDDGIHVQNQGRQKNNTHREFLLAERSILKEINALLKAEGDGELSGNIFTLKLNGRDAEITNEITGSELTVTRDELKALAADYSAEVKRLRKRS